MTAGARGVRVTEVRFYHLQRTTLEDALPRILEKVLERGQRAVVILGSRERVEQMNAHLWTYRPDSFLPHGSAADGHADDQPVWLTAEDERPNGAQVLILADGAVSDMIADYEVCCEMFDGGDPAVVEAARRRWIADRDAGLRLTYWQQRPQGGWEKKAEHPKPEAG